MRFMTRLWKSKISSNSAGRLAEWLCRMYMRVHGYRIVAKNYHCGTGKNTPCGELDFVAVRGKTLIFCEVKNRKNETHFLSALTYKQQQRILKGGSYFLNRNPQYKHHAIQFDVFFVKLPCSIYRIKNALSFDKAY